MEEIRNYIESSNFKLNCALDKKFFTRNRQLPFATLVVFILNLIRKSLQVEIGIFTRFLDVQSFSKQAFSKARKKLSPDAFKLLNEKLITEFYTDNDFKNFKGLRLLAIDGSTLRLPCEDDLYEQFGFYERKEVKSVPIAAISTAYDVLNNITLHATIAPYKTSERDMARENISEVFKLNNDIHKNSNHKIDDLLIFDRGYPSGIFMHFLFNKEKHFLIRMQINTFDIIEESIRAGIKDKIINIPVLNSNQRKTANAKLLFGANKKDLLKVRMLIFDLSNNEKEVIFTSLLDKNKFTYDDIFKIYSLRWNTEENYKLYKCVTDLENFSGKSKLAIEQDFYATVFTCNIASMLAQEAQEEIEQDSLNKTRKYNYKINRNILIGTIKNEIIEILLGNQNLNDYCNNLKIHIKRNLVPIRPNRSYPRIRRIVNRKITIDKGCI